MDERFGRGKSVTKRDDPRTTDGDGPPMPHAAPECPITFEFGGIRCVRPAGHPGPHRGEYVGLWFNDDGRRIEGGSAEDYA